MTRSAGLWVDHREAVVVFVGEGAERTQRIVSGMEKHVRYTGHGSSEDGAADDQRDRQYATHLNHYYDDVIAHMGETESILLFGPGEAKGELAKRFASKGLGARIVGVETVDKMTEPQVAAHVREHFKKSAQQPHRG